MTTIFTIGYEGTDTQSFIQTLRDAGVRIVADVRELPLSRKAGFSKAPLRASLESSGFVYRHFRDLGDPKLGRAAAKAGEIDSFRKIYGAQLRTTAAQSALNELARIARTDATCLMCFECDPQCCHRTIVADALMAWGFATANLTPARASRDVRYAAPVARRGSREGVAAA